MLDAGEIKERLQLGRESRGLELKGPGPRTDKRLLAKVARAALSLGNLRDGGHVIIGIDDEDPASLGPGLSDEDLASWTAHDELARKLANYSDPPLSFRVAAVELETKVPVAVIEVDEFADIPHLSAEDFPGVLRKGALYVRSRGVPETAEPASGAELRDVLEVAREKALRAYVETAERAGVALRAMDRVDDAGQYRAEEDEAWG